MADIKVPELAESITEGTVVQWLKKPGDVVKKGDYVVELETDKVNVEITSDCNGVLSEIKANEGENVKIGETIAVISEDNSLVLSENQHSDKHDVNESELNINLSKQDSPITDMDGKQPLIASPSARKWAREKGIDLKQIPTMDPLGRIRVQDVSRYNQNQKNDISTENHQLLKELTNYNSNNDNKEIDQQVERIRMSRRRQTIAKKLVEVQQTAAMLTTFNEIDMSKVMSLRKRRKDQFFSENDVKLGFMSFFTKAVVASLKKVPYLNAEIQGDEILLKKFYDIGVAVSTDDGLVVPVIRDADRKNFAEIEGDIVSLADKARQKKLSLQELQGGTFTITNGGVFGSLLSTPIINGPQVAILGMHSIQLRPIAIDEEKIENRPMMYVALSYDHRIVDGKEAVTFLRHIKELIEDPESLLFET